LPRSEAKSSVAPSAVPALRSKKEAATGLAAAAAAAAHASAQLASMNPGFFSHSPLDAQKPQLSCWSAARPRASSDGNKRVAARAIVD